MVLRKFSFDQISLIILLVVWCGLIIPGLWFGLPQQLDPDEHIFVNSAFDMLVPPYGDPNWYGAPASTIIDVLAIFYAIQFAVGILTGVIEEPWRYFYQNYEIFLLQGRILSAITLGATVWVLHYFFRMFVGSLAALLGSMAFLVSPQIVEFGQVTRMDIPMIFFVTVVLVFCYKYMARPNMVYCACFGAALGGAVVSKYPGVFAVFPILFTAGYVFFNNKLDLRRVIQGLIVAAFSSILVAFILAPFLFIDFFEMIEDVTREARSEHLSATARSYLDNIQYYLLQALPEITGHGTFLLGITGVVVGWYCRLRAPLALVLSFAIPFFAFLVYMPLQWMRWALPLAFLFSAGIACVVECREFVYRNISIGASRVIALVVIIALIPGASVSAYRSFLKATDRHTQMVATSWIYKNIPKRSRIAAETYTPQLPFEDYVTLVPNDGELVKAEGKWELHERVPMAFTVFGREMSAASLVGELKSNVDYIMVSNWADRFENEGEKYTDERSVYDLLFSKCQPVQTFESSMSYFGSNIRVFEVKQCDFDTQENLTP